MKWVLSCLLLWVTAVDAFACANTVTAGTKHDGSVAWNSGHPFRRYGRLLGSLKQNLVPEGEKMERELQGKTGFKERNDYAVALMYLGRSNEAVALLQQLEAEKPGEYFVAANLGTAFELSGNNAEAMRWIREGIRRDATSHEGTEWLHVKILEAKIAQEKDPDYFKKHSVLDLDPAKITSKVVIDDHTFTPDDLLKALHYQLIERMKFVKPPDAPVASLLFDYAAVEAATHTLETAKRLLEVSVLYGYPADRVDPLVALYDQRIDRAFIKKVAVYLSGGVLAVAVVVGLLMYCYRRGWFVLWRRDLKPRG